MPFQTIILRPPTPSDDRVTACRSCGQKIVWRETMAGKKIPLDHTAVTETLEHGYEEVDRQFVHFTTCPDAEKWRKK